jgi:GMP synthase-like glutamine amidotransferase
MKPVLLLQHRHDDGPAFLTTWLRTRGVPFYLVNTEAGQDFPTSMVAYSALAVLGGSMSANDDLPSLRQAERLILESMMHQLPVIGHCLGGQLMARALGAKVRPCQAEIGWHQIDLTPAGAAWFDDMGPCTVFQWHQETFDIPAGAELLASSAACPHQAFALGPHLAMQFHVELDDPKLQDWVYQLEADKAFEDLPMRQSPKVILEQARIAMSAQQRLASRLYERWLRSVLSAS